MGAYLHPGDGREPVNGCPSSHKPAGEKLTNRDLYSLSPLLHLGKHRWPGHWHCCKLCVARWTFKLSRSSPSCTTSLLRLLGYLEQRKGISPRCSRIQLIPASSGAIYDCWGRLTPSQSPGNGGEPKLSLNHNGTAWGDGGVPLFLGKSPVRESWLQGSLMEAA